MEALRPGVPGLAEEMIDAIRAAVPAYARPLEGAFGAAIRTGVEQALSQFLDADRSELGDVGGQGRDIYAELGRGELREGRTIEALLGAYRLGARVAWRRTSEIAREAGFDSEAMSLLAEAIFAYIDELSARSAAGYAEEQSAAAGEAARRRRALVALLVQTPAVDPASAEAAAREAGWELPATLAVLAWRDEGEQPVARRLPRGSLSAALDDGLVCALVPDAGAPGRREEIERALGRRAAALGPAVHWAETWTSARRAFAAHRVLVDAGRSQAGLVVAEQHLCELIVHGDRSLLGELVERRLAPLADRSPTSRERLLETLSAWLAHQGSVTTIADELHVHPQTVRYRLAQLRELFGDALDDPEARFELSLACRGAVSPYGPAGSVPSLPSGRSLTGASPRPTVG